MAQNTNPIYGLVPNFGGIGNFGNLRRQEKIF